MESGSGDFFHFGIVALHPTNVHADMLTGLSTLCLQIHALNVYSGRNSPNAACFQMQIPDVKLSGDSGLILWLIFFLGVPESRAPRFLPKRRRLLPKFLLCFLLLSCLSFLLFAFMNRQLLT
jgi:hypothetical protein